MSLHNYITLLKLTKQRNPTQMTGYKDRTWCNQICGNMSCPRNLTNEEVKKAIEWWGGEDFPIAKADRKTDDCGHVPLDKEGFYVDMVIEE